MALLCKSVGLEGCPGGQWLRLWASTASGTGSIPAQETKILHATRCGQEIEENGVRALSQQN